MSYEYTLQLMVNLTVSLQLIVSGLLFLHPLKKRTRFPLRLILSLCCCALIYTAAVWMRMRHPTLTTRFAMRLMHIGKTVYVVGETVTPAAGNGDLLILGTGSGETATLKAVAGKAEKAGVRILTITTNDQSTLAKQADDVIRLPASVNHLTPNGTSWQPGGTSFEQSLLLLADAVVLDVAQNTGTDISGKLTLHANLE